MAEIIEERKIEGEDLVIAKLEEKEKDVKLDNLLTTLNFEDFNIHKIKVMSITNGKIKEDAKYETPKINELYVLEFKNVDDILEFKVKGLLKNNKFNILFDFKENILQIKTIYTENFTRDDIKNIIEKF